MADGFIGMADRAIKLSGVLPQMNQLAARENT